MHNTTSTASSLQFLGATNTVTGSRYLVRSQGRSMLVDCGLFQGYKQLRLRNWAKPPFDVKDLDAVVLTHAHIDHSGYIPLLAKMGFRGRIYATPATIELCRILLPDSGFLQEEQARFDNRHNLSKHKPALPLYTEADAKQSLELFEAVRLDEAFAPMRGVTASFLNASLADGPWFQNFATALTCSSREAQIIPLRIDAELCNERSNVGDWVDGMCTRWMCGEPIRIDSPVVERRRSVSTLVFELSWRGRPRRWSGSIAT